MTGGLSRKKHALELFCSKNDERIKHMMKVGFHIMEYQIIERDIKWFGCIPVDIRQSFG
jgi:hypothetical protein